jgi:hypothetical protein
MADDIRVQKILHKGKHVASVHTYRGRFGGSVSQAHNPDGSEATRACQKKLRLLTAAVVVLLMSHLRKVVSAR